MSTSTGGQAPPAGGYSLSEHISRTLRLAVPAMLGRAGLLILITVDTAMTGHAGAAALAHYGLSLAPFQIIMVAGIGLLAGTPILVAQRDGADRQAECGAVWRAGLVLAAVLGCLGAIGLLFLGEPLFLALDQSPEMAAGAAKALAYHALGLPAMLLFLATAFFLEGISRPVPAMVVSLAVNLLNVGLNWLLIDGHLGAPAMGASGAALATALTRWVMFALLALYLVRMRDAERYGVHGRWRGEGETLRKSLRLGTPLALTTGLEVGAFSLVATFAGRLGDVAMASYQTAMNVTSLIFMLSIGLAAATAIRVANAVGRRDDAGLRAAASIGIGLTIALNLVFGVLIALSPGPISAFYSNDPAVQALATTALLVVAAVLVVDGAQAVLASAARALGDVFVPLLIFAVTFWAIGVPLAFYAGLRFDLGVPGLLGAMAVGLGLAALALGLRFHFILRRGPRPL